ncbi:hypothetical protein Ndes2437A_g03725 [Nannochloris sp. 'desiccata']
MSGADNAGHATKVPAQPHSGSERGVQQPRNWYFASILRSTETLSRNSMLPYCGIDSKSNPLLNHRFSFTRRQSRQQHHYSKLTTCRLGSGRSDPTPQFAEWTQGVPSSSSSYPWHHPTSLTMTALTIIQAAALVGAIVGGILARKRRKQLEETNLKLRKINQELRRKNAEAAPDDLAMYKTALERSLGAPSAAHPVEAYGSLKLSLARARRRVEEIIKEAKLLLHNSSKPPEEAATAALPLLAEALQLSKDIKDLRAERAVSKLRARALRSLGDLSGSLQELQQVLDLTAAVGESGEGDADILGEMGDVLAEMGNFEAAGKYYDLTIEAIQGNNNSPSAGSPSA